MSDTTSPKAFGWVLLELMGHRQRVGQAREEEIAGGVMLRIDIPVEDDEQKFVTEYYGSSAIYALRPISEEMAKDHWARSDPRPSRRNEYRREPQQIAADYDDDDEPSF